MGWGALKKSPADLRTLSLYEAHIGLAGYAHHHGGKTNNGPPLTKDELERRKARLRKMNIPGVEI